MVVDPAVQNHINFQWHLAGSVAFSPQNLASDVRKIGRRIELRDRIKTHFFNCSGARDSSSAVDGSFLAQGGKGRACVKPKSDWEWGDHRGLMALVHFDAGISAVSQEPAEDFKGWHPGENCCVQWSLSIQCLRIDVSSVFDEELRNLQRIDPGRILLRSQPRYCARESLLVSPGKV